MDEQTKKKLQGIPEKIEELEGYPDIKGLDLSADLSLDSFLQSFARNGMQATNLGKAIATVKEMRRNKATIFLTFTSNMISSGNRDIITYLVKNKLVDVLVTTTGGIEEDIMKCFAPFKIGDFAPDPRVMRDKGVFRIGNIFVPASRYAKFEDFVDPLLKQLYADNKKVLAPHELIREMGLALSVDTKEESYVYWAAKNNIPVFCPGIVDGSLGDLLYFFKYNHKDFCIDVTGDSKKINDFVLSCDKTSIICLGGGTPKHFALNANMLREGVEYAVYVNTAQEYDGSDSGASPSEAMTWSKIKIDALHVKVVCDATIAFPIIAAAAFGKEL